MALIQCPECSKEISDKAAACPHCGNPLTPRPDATIVATAPGEVVTTEATGKLYKATQLAGVFLMCAGVVACSAVQNGQHASALFWLAGSALYAVGRIAAWWHHG